MQMQLTCLYLQLQLVARPFSVPAARKVQDKGNHSIVHTGTLNMAANRSTYTSTIWKFNRQIIYCFICLSTIQEYA